MENHAHATTAATVTAATEEASVRPRMLRPTNRRPRMPWEVSLAEVSPRPRPTGTGTGSIGYFPYYLYGNVVQLKNGRAVL